MTSNRDEQVVVDVTIEELEPIVVPGVATSPGPLPGPR